MESRNKDYVLVMANNIPTNKYPLNGVFELDQSLALRKHGVNLIYAAIDIRSILRWRKWGVQKYKKDDILVYVINIPVGNLPKWIVSTIAKVCSYYLFKIIYKENGKPSLIHSHCAEFAGYCATLIKKKYNIPVVITEHSSLVNKVNIDIRSKKHLEFAYNNCDRVIAVSTALSKMIKNSFDIDSVVIGNIVDTIKFSYVQNKKKDSYTFVSVGNLVESKGFEYLIIAFSKAFEDNDNIKLIIIGDGAEKDKLEKLVEEKADDNKIVLMGYLDRSEISNILNNSDCFVLASKGETFGVVYIEALATGTPVITTRCGGPEDFVTDSNGVIVEVDNIEQLTNALIYMYKNSYKYNKKEISDNIKEMFSSDVIGDKILDVFSSINSSNYKDGEV